MRKALIILALSLSFLSASAKENPKYSITALGVYAWNVPWKHHGGVDLLGYLPVCRHFEADVAFETLSSRVVAFGAIARPKLPLPVGELFIDAAIHDRLFAASRISELALAASAGYRMDYVSAQVGVLSRRIYDHGGISDTVTEPTYFLYRVAVNTRPSACRWNIFLGAGNYTEFHYERTWQPTFFLGGRFDCSTHLTALLRIELKPSGMFSQTTNFWGSAIRAGATYKF